MILFILLGGYPPFYDESEPRLFDKIRWGRCGVPLWGLGLEWDVSGP